jgi:hypothetical protein
MQCVACGDGGAQIGQKKRASHQPTPHGVGLDEHERLLRLGADVHGGVGLDERDRLPGLGADVRDESNRR